MPFPTINGVLDDFNRANETPLASPWINPVPAAGVNLPDLVSNALRQSTNPIGAGIALSGANIDQEAYYTITVLPVSSSDFSVTIRGAGSDLSLIHISEPTRLL